MTSTQIQPTPADAWARLAAGNKRFTAGTPDHPNQGADRREYLQDQQHPFAMLFGCSDSRVAAELIFDVGLGDMFVVRTAGQVADTGVMGTLEYGVDILDIPLLVVLGHDECGAVTAARDTILSGTSPGGFMSDLVARILPNVLTAQKDGVDPADINSMVAVHTKHTAELLPERSLSLRAAVDAGRLAIAGVTYSLRDGEAHVVTTIGNL
ncbi:carbonic anhydrase [Spelaeicoccus albus]|uniref:carbonic anhydrase n=1 Tax=Spelaeicoccus albus TaxID=1280376 RepID=A0A7Z0D350_9MICO|nr:carbonic anhydrase [Spelaeicoccus albus]NYI68010.1 carbonic anhydrase [Spelaeicoccus albus]